jgi:hypothetical protein
MANHESKPKLSRADDPPGVIRCVPIIKIEPHDDVRAVILSDRIEGYYTHWDGRRTRPCTLDKDEKGTCALHACPRRWKGFLACVLMRTGKIAFVELTTLAGQVVKREYGNDSLRGLMVQFRRERNAKKAPIQVDFIGRYEEAKPLPPAPSVEPTLLRLWGLD